MEVDLLRAKPCGKILQKTRLLELEVLIAVIEGDDEVLEKLYCSRVHQREQTIFLLLVSQDHLDERLDDVLAVREDFPVLSRGLAEIVVRNSHAPRCPPQ